VQDPEYAHVYARCVHRFPDVARELPKPECWSKTQTATYSYQAVPPTAPIQQNWSAYPPTPIQPSAPPPPVTSSADSFFCSWPSECIFCGHQGHQICVCRATEDYIRSSHATVVNDHLHLPNSQPIPYDRTGRGIRASLDTWLATQSMPAPVLVPPPAQTCVIFAQDT